MYLVLAFVVVFALVLLARSVRVLGEHQRGLVMRLGRHVATVGPGTATLIPLIDEMILVDLRERSVRAEERLVFGAEGSQVASAEVFFRVLDPEKATLAVSDLNAAVTIRAGERLREMVRSGAATSSDEAALADGVRRALGDDAAAWGIEIARVVAKVEPEPARSGAAAGPTE